ncbi:MAG: hypothetical protein LHW56_01655 [Candidatus Cloacimonetes bacterium]|nr:hypothetical protein [Candidatus Cloacimonadota bacterium]MDY0171593.1 hypothetical protein [Candidatus Cloacimonadaceae bacterium]
MQDLRIYRRTGNFDVIYQGAEEMEGSLLSEAPAAAIEVLANRVVKFMLTSRGTDVFDSDYGSYLPTYTQVAQSLVPRMRLEVMDDLKRCQAYLQQADQEQDNSYKLFSLTLREFRYDPTKDRGRIDVVIEVLSVEGEKALLDLPYTFK